MRLVIFLFVFCFSYQTCYCQDTLYTKSRVPFPVKVIEINETEVRYINFSNPDGPDYVIRRNQVIKIIYQNGNVDYLNEIPSVRKQEPSKPYPWFKGYNTFSMLATDFLFSIATINFERTFLDDRLGIRIPFSVSFNASGKDSSFYEYPIGLIFPPGQQKGYYSKNKIYSTGFDLMIYPFKPGKVNYFAGPSFGYGEFYYWSEYYSNYPVGSSKYRKDIVKYAAFMIKNGINFRPANYLSISLNLAMGFQNLNLKNQNNGQNNVHYPNETIYRAFEASASIGYRF